MLREGVPELSWSASIWDCSVARSSSHDLDRVGWG